MAPRKAPLPRGGKSREDTLQHEQTGIATGAEEEKGIRGRGGRRRGGRGRCEAPKEVSRGSRTGANWGLASMGSRREGTCRVYAQELLKELVTGCEQDVEEEGKRGGKGRNADGKGRRKRSGGGGRKGAKTGGRMTREEEMERKQKRHLEAKKVMRNKAYWAKMEKIQEQSEREVRDRLEAQRVKKEARFQEMYQAILDGKEYTDNIDRMLEFHEEMERRKRVSRYNEWNENVFGRIQKEIASKLAKRGHSEASKLRREEYAKFLETTNKKSSLFLDIIIESDYDPFVVNRNAITYDGTKFDDPTKRVLAKHQEELDMIPGQAKAPARASRVTFPVQMWASGKVESTPHGYFSKLMSSSKGGSSSGNQEADAERAQMYKSRSGQDHFEFPKSREAIDAEFPRGKRTDFSHLPHVEKLLSKEPPL
ncbi:Protein FAM228B [Durusdinium trenchii]|uniref:Protein FAM228B n=1 Tax=Durusdinium trenchii TaxID=1381693 RepID=A0ABP0NBB4_9DINO